MARPWAVGKSVHLCSSFGAAISDSVVARNFSSPTQTVKSRETFASRNFREQTSANGQNFLFACTNFHESTNFLAFLHSLTFVIGTYFLLFSIVFWNFRGNKLSRISFSLNFAGINFREIFRFAKVYVRESLCSRKFLHAKVS